MKLKLRLILAVLMLAALGAGKYFFSHPHTITASPSSQKDVLRFGQLHFQSCEIGKHGQRSTFAGYCSQFAVPENRAMPDGRQIQLKVALIKSESAKPDADVVVFLDGGPGGAAINDYPAVADALAPLRRRHHILLVDQRGTGGSNALECPALDATGKNLLDKLADQQFDAAHVKQLIQQCAGELQAKADPRYYTTTDAIEDLEAIRLALDAPQTLQANPDQLHVTFDLIGVSYGTRVAQQYATRYPAAVRSIVLDSAIPNTLVLGLEHSQVLEDALKAQLAACNSTPACVQRLGDAYANLHTLHQRLRAHPVRVEMRDPNTFVVSQRTLTADGLVSLVRLYAYNPVTSALLPLMSSEALHGNYAPLLGQVQLVLDSTNEILNTGMGLSVICAEDADLLHINPADSDTLLGNSLIEFYQQACPVWPHAERPAHFHDAFDSSLPMLVLSGEYDPVTPPRYGAEIVRSLPNARQLILRGQGHAVMNTHCVPELLEHFVNSLNAHALDASCLDALAAIPMFIDYNGATP